MTKQKQLPIFIRTSHIRILLDCSEATAWRKKQIVKDALALASHQDVTCLQFCKYYNIEVAEAVEKIG